MHLDPPKAESILVLKGSLVCVEFSEDGKMQSFYRLSPDSFNIGIDLEPGIYHTIFATAEDTVLFEAKPGPYERGTDKVFASWAPAEYSDKTEEYLKNLYELTGSTPCIT